MAKRRAPRKRRPVRDALPGPTRIEVGADGYDYEVRPVSAARAAKNYRCPGCDHEIKPGISHVVVLPADSSGSVDDSRHWHTPCWANRATRGPTRKWS